MSCDCDCDCRRLADEMERNRHLQQRCHEQEMLAQRQVAIIQTLVSQIKRQRLEEELFDRLARSANASHALAHAILGEDGDTRPGIAAMLRDLHDEHLERLLKKDRAAARKRKAKK